MDLNTSVICLNLNTSNAHPAIATAECPMDIGTCSDSGRVRENNEDSLRVAQEMNLYVVSDGMGGLACGEIASCLTVDTLLTHCREAEADPSLALFGTRAEGTNEISSRLASGIRLANRIVYRAARKNGAHQGMGATVVAVQWANDRMSIAHVGDSRAYRLRNECLELLTQDHSFTAEQLRLGHINKDEAQTSRLQNILTRAVGVEPELEVEVSEETMQEGDTMLLCSDGLTHELSDKQIEGVLRDAKNSQAAATQLVDLANQAGGSDNITTVVIRQVPQASGIFSRAGRLGRLFSGR
jgi:serine/threonine protein phosphatase PrpC